MNKTKNKMDVHFSSSHHAWETPPELFNEYDEKFHFDLDVCATDENAKCEAHFTPEDDGLAQEWTGTCWMNPPYGRGIDKWIKKAYESDDATVVCLLPARTDTAWFHDYILKARMKGEATVEFLRGRVKFVGAKNSAPFPSMIVVFLSAEEVYRIYGGVESYVDGT